MVSGPRTGDAFGALLRAALDSEGQPGAVLEVVERDDGHVRVNDAMRYLAPSWGVLDEWAYGRVSGRVLDLGCGAGRHALVLQERKFDVVALDPSEGGIDVCRRRGVRNAVVGTAFDLSDDRGFDTVLLLGNNLGLLGGRESGRVLLDRLAALARPGACVLATGVAREPGTADDDCDRAYVASNLARGRLPWQVTMRSRYLDLATDWFDYVFLGMSDLDELLEPTPWHVTEHLATGPAYAVRLALQQAS